jgi:hypothetical protein
MTPAVWILFLFLTLTKSREYEAKCMRDMAEKLEHGEAHGSSLRTAIGAGRQDDALLVRAEKDRCCPSLFI